MKKIFLVFISLISFFTYSQKVNADQIITKHIKVTGGTSQWGKLTNIKIIGEIVLGLQESYFLTIYQQRPNLTKTILEIQDQKVILEAYNGKKAISFNFRTNAEEEIKNYIPESFESDLLNYKKKGFQSELLEEEKVNGLDCYKIKLTKNNTLNFYYFDKKNYQLVREENAIETKDYSDFKTVSGLTFPFKTVVKSSNNDSDFTLILKTIEINKKLPNEIFKL